MARVPLSDTRKWELVHSDQDLRGKPLWDAHGHELGIIREMIVDTDSKRVTAVVLDTGDQFSAHDLSVSDDAVYVLNYDASANPPASVRHPREAPAEPRRSTDGLASSRDGGEPVRGRSYTDYNSDFRSHYDDEYSKLGRDFTDWEPAYRFGYDMAFEPEYSGRDFEAAEDDLRIGFYRRMGYPMSDRHVWEDVRGAVRHAYHRARRDERGS